MRASCAITASPRCRTCSPIGCSRCGPSLRRRCPMRKSNTRPDAASQEFSDIQAQLLQAQNIAAMVLQKLYDTNAEGDNARLATVLQASVDILDSAYDRLD